MNCLFSCHKRNLQKCDGKVPTKKTEKLYRKCNECKRDVLNKDTIGALNIGYLFAYLLVNGVMDPTFIRREITG